MIEIHLSDETVYDRIDILMKAVVFIVGILILSISIAGFIILNQLHLSSKSTTPTKKTLPASSSSYTDPQYHFSFSYPSHYDLHRDSNKLRLVGDQVTFYIKIMQTTLSVRGGILTFCRTELKSTCIIDSQTVYTNESGFTGNKYFFKEASLSGKLTTEVKGPVYVFELPLANSTHTLLIFYQEGFSEMIDSESDLKAILQTLTLPQKSTVLVPSKTSSTSGSIKTATSAAK